jgi:RNA polymerase sigma factor (sigma-70 family)
MTEPLPPDEHLAALMRAAQVGDAGAYLELLRIITPRLRQIVGRRRGFAGTEEVEDLVQDVLLSLHSVRATYHADRPFMPWLLAIARNRLADGARRHARTTAHEVHTDDREVTFGSNSTNSVQGSSDDVETLQQAIQALPAGQRQAIELLKLQELSLKEAAAATGSSVAALKVATHRAIATLRGILGGGRRRA